MTAPLYYRRKLSNDIDISAMMHMRENGMTNKEIAKALGVSDWTVSHYLPKTKDVVCKKWTEEDRQKCIERFLNGESVKWLAECYGRTYKSVYNMLTNEGAIAKKKELDAKKSEVQEDIPIAKLAKRGDIHECKTIRDVCQAFGCGLSYAQQLAEAAGYSVDDNGALVIVGERIKEKPDSYYTDPHVAGKLDEEKKTSGRYPMEPIFSSVTRTIDIVGSAADYNIRNDCITVMTQGNGFTFNYHDFLTFVSELQEIAVMAKEEGMA